MEKHRGRAASAREHGLQRRAGLPGWPRNMQFGEIPAVLLGLQLAFLVVAALRRGLPRYYALVTWATVVSLWNYLRRGVPATWDAAEGTR